MHDRQLGFDAVFAQLVEDALEILAAGLNLGCRRQRAVELAHDAFFDVQQIDLRAVRLGQSGGMGHRVGIALGVIERYQNPLVPGRFPLGGLGLQQADRCPPPAAEAGWKKRLEGDPEQQERDGGDDRKDREPDPGTTLLEPVSESHHDQPDIESDEKDRRGPGQYPNPGLICELAHAGAVAGEMDERNHGERQLHAQDHLAQDQQLVDAVVACNRDRDGRRNDGHQARDQAAQPWPHAEIEEAFHDDLARHGSGQRRGLAGAQQRHGEDHARQAVPSSGASSWCACWISVTTMPLLKNTAAASIRIAALTSSAPFSATTESIRLYRQATRFVSGTRSDPPRLHQRRVQIQVVRHHRRAEDADRDVQALAR